MPGTLLPQGICTDSSLWNTLLPDTYLANCLTSFKLLLVSRLLDGSLPRAPCFKIRSHLTPNYSFPLPRSTLFLPKHTSSSDTFYDELPYEVCFSFF